MERRKRAQCGRVVMVGGSVGVEAVHVDGGILQAIRR